ncbi:MAG: TPM domain-containing protein [Pseudobdellovibrio sp.]
MFLKNLAFSFILILGVSFNAYSFDIPTLTGPVMDEVGAIGPSTKRQLEDSLYNLRKQQNVQLQVYVVKSLQGEVIESAAIKIFDKWKLGDEKTDKGLLFLIAPNEKRMRIEVGQGLEGDIPDVIAKRIISDVVKPYFQRGQYSLGIVQGVSALENYIGNDDPNLKKQIQEEQQAQETPGKKSGAWLIFIIIGIWIILFIFNPSLALYLLFSMMNGGGRGGGGGGGWSGGGGSSSGGGASGSW